MATKDTIKRLGADVCADFLGFTPTSNSTKPPHIANALFREVLGEVCDFGDVHEWIVSERRKDAISSEAIIDKYKNILVEGEHEKVENIRELRFLLEDLFNPDHTVYPSYQNSVANISSHWLVKGSLAAEGKIGRFIFEILAKKIDGEYSPAIKLLQNALNMDNDDLTKLIKPIIVFPSEDAKREVKGINYPLDNDIKWDSCKAIIRQGFDNLARNMIRLGEDKNSLLVMERMVNFACFSTFFYLINAHAVMENKMRSPIFLDAGDDIESVKKASEYCYAYAKTEVEEYYISAINSILMTEIKKERKEECQKWVEGMRFDSVAREEEISKSLFNYFESFCEDGDTPVHALAHALQIVLYTFDYKNNTPSDFCRVIGVRCGLIGPRGNRANIKRYLANSFTLETITYSVLSEEDIDSGIELREFGQKATEAYNILFGADVDWEYKILAAVNIAQRTPGDLRSDMSLNFQRIADLFISLGMAHRYADGVTMLRRENKVCSANC